MKKILFIAAVVACSGCERIESSIKAINGRYSAVASADSTIYVVDKETGKVFQTKDEKLVELQRVSLTERQQSTAVKEFPPTVPSGYPFRVTPKIEFRGSKLYYQISVEPMKGTPSPTRNGSKKWYETFNELRKEGGNALTLQLHDENGFQIMEIVHPISKLMQLVDTSGTTGGYSGQGNIPVTYDEYNIIEGCSISWNF